MRLPIAWLHEYCVPELDTEALADRLTMTGTKVERIFFHGVGALEHFVVGKVLTAEPHPDADRLRVCTVDVGEADPAQIVCGAPNVAAGQTVAVARPGAVMPDGTTLGTAKLRGVASSGMILAEDELAIGTDHDGTMVLDDVLAAGSPLADALPIATDVLELEITPNRPDCLGLYGVAREVHAATGAALAPPPWADDPGSEGDVDGVEVTVECPDLCPRFTVRAFDDVTIGPSPAWLKARLMAMGQRPISNVVDITNYVMLLTGQALHAFDADRVAGARLNVRRAREGEQIETLDGVTRTLDPEIVLIEDADGPTSIAGVMGGARSEVHDGTTRVWMEAATWDGPNIQRTSTRLGLRSEASARFEKGLSTGSTLEGQAVAAALMVELCGATLRPGTTDAGGEGDPPRALRLRAERVSGLLGHAIDAERCAEILQLLGFGVEIGPGATADVAASSGGAVLSVTVPHWRARDVTREVDLVEEVARIDGLEKIPHTLTALRTGGGRLTREQRLRRRAADALVGAGLYEIAGWSFTAPGLVDALRLASGDARRSLVRLRNPLSEDLSVMRTTLLGGLLDAARHNRARGAGDLGLFEVGAVYRSDGRGAGELPSEPRHAGALLSGAARPATWRDPEPPAVDFFAAKGVLATLLDALRVEWSVSATGAEPFLHPGRAASVEVAGAGVGWLGELHPEIAGAWDLASAAGFEVDLGAIVAAAPGAEPFVDVTSFPAVRQDLAVVVGEEVTAAQVLATARAAGAPLLARADVFDVYRGAQAGEGRYSLALRLAFRAPDRTLTDEEAAPARAAIVDALRDHLGAELRG